MTDNCKTDYKWCMSNISFKYKSFIYYEKQYNCFDKFEICNILKCINKYKKYYRHDTIAKNIDKFISDCIDKLKK